jgi:S1-C subfamily serine protease
MPKLTRNARPILTAILFLSLVSLACGITIPRLNTIPPTPVIQAVPVNPPGSSSTAAGASNDDQVVIDLYSRLNPSVVNISIYQTQNAELVLAGQASGFVYDSLGNIVTNQHVVEGADSIQITFADGLIRDATLVAQDLFSDLAVVKVDLPAGVNPIPLGAMDQLAVGESVVAIGNPFGLEGTLTRGVISALGRTIPTNTLYSIPQAIQTDAAINPGNSGGPLLNLNGDVIGVNAQIETSGLSSSNLGVGFAIPVSILQRVIPALIQDGHYDWSWLGVSGYTVDPSLVKAMSLPVEQGAFVSTVTPGGPAEAAGVIGSTGTVTQDGRTVEIGGDVITAIDGQAIKTFDDVLVYLSLHTSPGQVITLSILRNGQYQDVDVTLGTRPTQ